MPRSMHDLEATRDALQDAFDFAQSQVTALLGKYPADYYPMYTVEGKFGRDRKRWTHWCDGFYPGMMFIFAARTKDVGWLDKAIAYAAPLEERQYDRAVHDLGFLFFSTYLRWLDLSGPAERIKPVLIQAGKTMAMRFMAKGQYLRSFVEPASLFIDIMMNVGTLFYAGQETGDGPLLQIAHRHCETTRRTLVRGDGSTAHEALFDLTTGECLRQSTHQGYRRDSCWSRGLAWSLYGFTRSHLQTRRGEYLETAMLNADYYLEHTPSDGVTPWDYDAPDTGPLAKTQVDTSAAAIASSGLLDLADAVSDPVKAPRVSRFRADLAGQSLAGLSGPQHAWLRRRVERRRVSHPQRSGHPRSRAVRRIFLCRGAGQGADGSRSEARFPICGGPILKTPFLIGRGAGRMGRPRKKCRPRQRRSHDGSANLPRYGRPGAASDAASPSNWRIWAILSPSTTRATRRRQTSALLSCAPGAATA